MAVLCGLGGAGKTSVAVEYAHRHLGEALVCWQFAAEDPAVLAAQFGVLAAQLGAGEVVDARDPVTVVHALLARAESGWLVIFDNAPDLGAVQAFLPPAGPGRVLITSQSQHWAAGWGVQVRALDPEVAAQFLTVRTGDADQDAALELASELGGLPLALEQAAAYMQATGTSMARYLPLFRGRQADLLARGEAAGHREHAAATLGLALSRLGQDAPAAVGLLRLLAFLAPEPVPLGLLLAGNKAEQLGAETAGVLGPLLSDPLAVGDAVAALRRYSLASLAGDGLVQVHRLVQAVTSDQMPVDLATEWRECAVALIEAALPLMVDRPETWPAFAVLLPHALAVLPPDSDGMAKMAEYVGQSGDYSASRDLWRRISDARVRALGREAAGTLSAQASLAYWTGMAGDQGSARDQLAALMPAYARVLGKDNLEVLTARASLARGPAWPATRAPPVTSSPHCYPTPS